MFGRPIFSHLFAPFSVASLVVILICIAIAVVMPLWIVVLVAIALWVIIVLALATRLDRNWIAPTLALSDAVHQMTAGEWQTHIEPNGEEEIRALGVDLNHLAVEAERRSKEVNVERTQLRVLVDQLPDPIFLTDAKQRIAVINAPAARLLDCTPEQALGKLLLSVLNESTLIAMFELARSNPDHIEPREVRITRHGQRMIFQAVALRPPSGKGVLLLLRDVTVMAGAVQMKTDFVANAGHELRTPIGAIKLAFETLQEVYQDDPQQADKCFAIASGQLKRLEELLADLLDLSRVESEDAAVQRAEVDLNELLESTRIGLSTLARQKVVELDIERGDNVPSELHSDRRLLQLIFRNLGENAIKFTPTGGRVTISAAREGDGVIFSVTDNGIGIPEEHQVRVFERFYQVDTSRSGTVGRGTGLGLAIVKHAVSALGGSLQLESEIGKGTRVECWIPIEVKKAF